MTRTDQREIRLGLPSKGRLEGETLAFLDGCGLRVDRINPRQYVARIPALPQVTVWFQRASVIPFQVRDGDIDLAITGYDRVAEAGVDGDVIVLYDRLGYGNCELVLAVPEAWQAVETVEDLAAEARRRAQEGRPLRVATKYTRLVGEFLEAHQVMPYRLIAVEGALEAAPGMGYADIIADLTATGTTLRDNHLKRLEGGAILYSEACLIGNRQALSQRPEVLGVARQLLEYIEAHLRARSYHAIIANIRGESPEAVAARVFSQPDLGGLQGPTISRVYVRDGSPGWYAISIVVRKDRLHAAVEQLRAIGGSGVVVTPATYIFEEEPAAYRRLLEQLKGLPTTDQGRYREVRH